MRKALSLTTIKRLFGLSGNLCAFNDCTEIMIDSHGNIIGRICHIEAANKKGQRYNKKSNDQVRKSYDNLILFCDKHHTVTNNITKYTVDVLKKMKTNHEKKFLNNPFKISEEVVKALIEKYEKPNAQKNIIHGGAPMINQAKEITQNFQYSYSQNDKEDYNIINEIFETVLAKISEGVGKNYKPEKSINLSDKIKLNFKNLKEQKEVSEYAKDAFLKRSLIKQKLQLIDTESQKDIHSHILGRYNALKRARKKNIEILTLMFDEFTPAGKKQNPAYVNLAKAFVLFFFEDCTIFEKTEAEKENPWELKF
jgi:hypothetical protein